MMDYWDGYNMMSGYGGFSALAFLFHLILLVVVIAGVIVLVKFLSQSTQHHDSTNSALDVLKRRYAKGEITKQEFDGMKKDIA